MASPSGISVLVPALNEARTIEATLEAVIGLDPPPREIIVADGGSTDGTPERVASAGVRVVHCATGRADQLNHAAAHAHGATFLFLHADTRLPPGAIPAVERALSDPGVVGGAFRLAYDPATPGRRAFAGACDAVGRAFASYGGHRAVFVRRRVFERVGGFNPDVAEESVDFTRRIGAVGRVVLLPGHAVTSARRLEEHGIPRVAWHFATCAWASWRGRDRPRPESEFYPEIR